MERLQIGTVKRNCHWNGIELGYHQKWMALIWDRTILLMKQKKIGKGMIFKKWMALSWNGRILLIKQKNKEERQWFHPKWMALSWNETMEELRLSWDGTILLMIFC